MPQGIEPSNLDKVFWPEEGYTKGDLIEYFRAVAPYLVKELRDRPLTVKRYPDGVDGLMFYQKDTPKYAPSWIRTVTLHAGSAKRDVRYPLCNSTRTLLWMANQAAIELHPWLARADRIERPDYLVFDLDPPEEGFERSVDAAFLVKEAFDEVGLRAALKTSGSKGVHVYAPLQRRYHYARVREAADALAARIQEFAPEAVTTDFAKATRAGRVLLDTRRNVPGQHIDSVYSPRARPGAPVSFPVPWEDIRRVRPEEFTIATVPPLLERHGDRWRELLPPAQALPAKLRG